VEWNKEARDAVQAERQRAAAYRARREATAALSNDEEAVNEPDGSPKLDS
jgi:hypothetical protein